MHIACINKYKSINPFDPIELPDLTVLTGLNGSGKSQLLDGLHRKGILCDIFGSLEPPPEEENYVFLSDSESPGIALIRNWAAADTQFSSAQHSRLGQRFGGDNQQNESRYGAGHGKPSFASMRSLALTKARAFLDEVTEGQIGAFIEPHVDPWRLGPEELAWRMGISETNSRFTLIQQVFLVATAHIGNPSFTGNTSLELFAAEVNAAAEVFDVDRLCVTEEMINDISSRIAAQMFQPNIVQIMANYRDIVVGNDLDEIEARKNLNKRYLTSEQFTERYGLPPWSLVSDLLRAMALPFEVVEPTSNMSEPVQFRLKPIDGGDDIGFQDLSSGEQVLLRFAVSLMRPNPGIVGLQRPRLLLLDEMDASLHPEMVQRWLAAIERGIVKDLGIKVILTTHSPTTVALAPEKSIFIMSEGRPKRISKQQAINKLTFGVPTLSIEYSGRRQVFCESDTDASVYEKIYAAMKPRISLSKELNFIGTGIRIKNNTVTTGEDEEINAGEAIVREIVNNLAQRGVGSVFGLVDWDRKAQSTERVIVMGEGVYYTLENILLDPLLIGSLMILERMSIPSLQFSPRSLDTLDPSSLQLIADTVQDNIEFEVSSNKKILVKYNSGICINVKEEFASLNGHKLEQLLTVKFPALRKYTTNKGKLTSRIADVVITDYPEFCPLAITDAFAALSSREIG